jgi:hypothetical protein
VTDTAVIVRAVVEALAISLRALRAFRCALGRGAPAALGLRSRLGASDGSRLTLSYAAGSIEPGA